MGQSGKLRNGAIANTRHGATASPGQAGKQQAGGLAAAKRQGDLKDRGLGSADRLGKTMRGTERRGTIEQNGLDPSKQTRNEPMPKPGTAKQGNRDTGG
ncbi:MAG: hypothetical protein U1E76_27755 [Planctomycetota bacterium]